MKSYDWVDYALYVSVVVIVVGMTFDAVFGVRWFWPW